MTDFATRYGPWGLVAGASDGTGAAFAEELAARGVNVVLVARRRPLLDELAARLPTESRVVVQDLSTPDAAQALADATADLDVGSVIYNAGADDQIVPLVEQPLDALHTLVRRNCLTVLDLCHHFGNRLVVRGRGGVVIASSGAAWVGGANLAAYGASKAFDLVLTESLWAEWREHGVDALALVMGATDTPTMRKTLAERGGTMDHLMPAADVAREALDHLGDGPTWATGMGDPQGPSPFGALPRRQAVELMTKATEAVHPRSA